MSQSARLRQLSKNIDANTKQYKKQAKKIEAPRTVQESIRYCQMFENGVCNVDNMFYSKTIQISDINYRSAKRDDQIDMFARYCEILNSFDPSIFVQMSISNRRLDEESFKRNMLLQSHEDNLQQFRIELNRMLEHKAIEGQNSIVREKYFTFGSIFPNLETAQYKLRQIESLIVDKFKSIGCEVKECSGIDRLRMISNQLCPDEKFEFDYSNLFYSGLTTKDFVCPASFDFSEKSCYEFGNYIGQTLYLKNLPAVLTDKLISDLSDLPIDIHISLHLHTVEQSEAFKLVNTQIMMMNSEKASEMRKFANKNMVFDESLMAYDTQASLKEAEELREQMTNQNQMMFKTTLVVNTFAEDIDKLDNNIRSIIAAARQNNCTLSFLDYRQEEALNSCLPLGKNFVNIERTLTTSSTAAFVPFTTQELYQEGGIYYGLNAMSRNLIFFDRKSLKAPNGMILGTPGSGKSFSAKREMVSVLLSDPNSEVLVIDPEREYTNLTKGFDGEIIPIAPTSTAYINPMDINLNYGDDDAPIKLKSEFLLSLCELLIGGRDGLAPTEKTLIDRCCLQTYRNFLANPSDKTTPTLVDFHKTLKSQPEAEASNIALALEPYITGSLSVFAHQTNVTLSKRLVVFDIKDLGKNLQSLGMLIVLDQIWNRISANRNLGKRTWIYIDELQLLFSSEQCSVYFFELWSRARKWGAIPTGITQNVQTLLLSEYGTRMLSNSDFILMLNQAQQDRQELAELLNLSDEQARYFTNSEAGTGLMFAGKTILPFVDKFPTDTKLYQMMTTKIEELVDVR